MLVSQGDRGPVRAADNDIKAGIIQKGVLSNESIMIFPHHLCVKIEERFKGIDESVDQLRKQLQKECRGGPLSFKNNQLAGGESIVLLDSPESLLNKVQKTIEWMKGAKEDVSGTKTLIFENKFGEKKEKLEMLMVGKAFLPRLSEVGINKKTTITADHQEMKEDSANPGSEISACYGKFANAENTQRTMFLVSIDDEMVEEGGYRYMPEGNEATNRILKDFSDLSMMMCEIMSLLHNWYGAQAEGNKSAMKEWVRDNWTAVACTCPELSIKSAKDLDLQNAEHMSGVIHCIVASRSIKSMPVGGFFVGSAKDGEGRVSLKSYGLRTSKRDQIDVERGWQLLGARYLEEWKYACIAKGMDVKGADTKDELQQDANGLPVDAQAMWNFIKKNVDHRYAERMEKNIAENLELAVPMGKYSSSCFDLLGPDLQSVRVQENGQLQMTRGLAADEYYAMLAKDLPCTGGVVISLVELCPRGRDVYANLTGLRILYPSRFVHQMRAPWEMAQNSHKDTSKKIALWLATDGIENQTRVMDLAGGAPGRDDVLQLNALTRCGSALRTSHLSESPKKRPRAEEPGDSNESPPKKKPQSMTPFAPPNEDLSGMGDDEFA